MIQRYNCKQKFEAGQRMLVLMLQTIQTLKEVNISIWPKRLTLESIDLIFLNRIMMKLNSKVIRI